MCISILKKNWLLNKNFKTCFDVVKIIKVYGEHIHCLLKFATVDTVLSQGTKLLNLAKDMVRFYQKQESKMSLSEILNTVVPYIIFASSLQ